MIRSRLSYALALGAGLAFYVFYKEWLSWFILLLLLLLPPVSLLLGWLAARRVELTLRAEPPAAGKEEAVRFVALLVNRGRLPVARCLLVLRPRNALGPWDAPRPAAVFLAGRSERQVEFTVSSQYAGKLQCRVERARCCDYLGLFTCRRLRARAAWAFVIPRAVPILPGLTAEPVPDWEGDGVHPGKPGEDPSETIDVRAYREGDSLRAIHWKLSGRAGELMVREFAQPVDQTVELLLDLGGGMEAGDLLLDALCSLHLFLTEAGVSHRVTWLGEGEELCSRRVDSDEAWTEALGDMLSRPGRRGAALALRLGGDGGAGGARVLYLCAAYGREEQDRLAALGNAAALLAVTGSEATAGAYPLRRETLGADLSAVTI